MRDRQRRTIKPPTRLGYADIIAYALNIVDEPDTSEPATYKDAISCQQKNKWLKAMKEEMDSLKKNMTWELVEQHKSHKWVGCKWIYKRKEGSTEGDGVRYKARLEAKGFTQREDIDYTEVFSPVVKQTSIRIAMSMVAKYDLELQQMDVTTAFLHGELDETIYMKQPEGFEEGKGKMCLLKKSLYGLKQSPRQWNKKFDNFMSSIYYRKSSYDRCVYMNGKYGRNHIILLLYVDDMLLVGKDLKKIEVLKS